MRGCKATEIYVLDPQYRCLDIIDSFNSSIWDIYYYEFGKFDLYLPATSTNISLLQIGNCLVRDKDVIDGNMYNVMIIDNIEIKTDAENGNYLTVTGSCLKSIMRRRIIWNQTNLNGTVESCLNRLITSNVISPTIPERAIDNVILGKLKGFTDWMSKQITGANLGETIIEICKAYELGWRVYVDSSRRIVVDFYKGKDRSNNQRTNPCITFSADYDTLLSSDYKLNTEKYRNVALVAGEGEGTCRKTYTVGSATGLNRYELYVDSRNASSNEGEISDTEYYSQLSQEGSEKLQEVINTESFEGEIEPASNYLYGKDYGLGDIVNVENEYGISAAPRIIGVIESNSDQGESIIPTFSTWKGDN